MAARDQPGAAVADAARPGSSHTAAIYRHGAAGLASAMSFAREGLARGDAVSIGVSAPLGRLLRRTLGERPDLAFFDMADLGRNPGRIIPAMLDFAAAHPGQRIRYVSQPFWPGRTSAEAVEAVRHEALVNLAFARANATILCLYDSAELDAQVVSSAEQTHPAVVRDGRPRASPRFAGQGAFPPACDRPLAAPPQRARPVSYEGDLRPVRDQVARCAHQAGLGEDRAADLVLAASEVAANTLRHTAGGGTVRLWSNAAEVICQVQDSGNVTDPLAGRWRPADRPSGHGLWVVNQICDLVEFRSGPDGTVVRMHMRLENVPLRSWGRPDPP